MTQIAPHVAHRECRSCASRDLHELIAFGETPLADRLVEPGDNAPDYRAPLTLSLCNACGLCQLRETVEPRILFHENYPYYTSVSPALAAHFWDSADALVDALGLRRDSLVIEAGSNDGTMLARFRDLGVGVLGIDPSDAPVRLARERGVETICGFLTRDLAAELAGKGIRADLFVANNVLAHVADTNGFVAGIAMLLQEDGTAVLEFPYLIDLVEKCAFDTIYHQHLLYLSLTSASHLFERHGLKLVDAQRIRVHGGSVRATVAWKGEKSERLQRLLATEAELSIATPDYFAPFLTRIEELKASLWQALGDYRQRGLTVGGYGAAAKATTLLHHFELGREDLAFIVDRSRWKQGLHMPGCRIPIVAPEYLRQNRVDVLLLLAWNFANEIISENGEFLEAGGEFLLPVPEITITRGAPVGVSF